MGEIKLKVSPLVRLILTLFYFLFTEDSYTITTEDGLFIRS